MQKKENSKKKTRETTQESGLDKMIYQAITITKDFLEALRYVVISLIKDATRRQKSINKKLGSYITTIKKRVPFEQ